MLVTCPKCKSIFKLPNTDQNIKMRCSICQTVFALDDSHVEPELTGNEESTPQLTTQIDTSFSMAPPQKPPKKIMYVLVMLLCSAMFAAGMLWHFTNILDPLLGIASPEEIQVEKENVQMSKSAEMVRLLEMTNVRQYTIPNEKIGPITVIEGKVRNGFKEKRELIRLEATLFDGEGNSLMTKSQLGGPKASLFQLQVLGEEELEQVLKSNLDILSANTNVLPGADVPFMFLFYNPPETASDFSIKIIDAKNPKNRKKASKSVGW